MLAEVGELDLNELSRGGRYEHLAGMARRGYAGGAMDVPTDVALVSEKRCPRVQTHTYLNGAGGKRPSQLCRRGECARRGREGEEKGIALRVDFDAVVASASISYQAAMLGECFRIALGAEFLEQPRRALDVGEEKGDRSGGEITPHRRHHASKQDARRRSPRDLIILPVSDGQSTARGRVFGNVTRGDARDRLLALARVAACVSPRHLPPALPGHATGDAGSRRQRSRAP